jgi:hypothetical protein
MPARCSPQPPDQLRRVLCCACRDMLEAVQQRYGPLERCADPHGEVAKNFKV